MANSALPPPPASCLTPPAGMTAWYPGDNDAKDIKGNNNGTYSGAFAPGAVANAFSFSGLDADFLTAPATAAISTPNITVDAWVKRSGSPGNFKYILTKGQNGCNGGGSYALYTGPTGGLFFYVSNGNVFALSPDGGAGVWDNQWHHVAGTYDGLSVKLYVDGNLVGSTPTNIPINYALQNNNLFIGNYPNCGNLSFPGLVDEVEIFNRALTQPEVQSIYKASSKGKCKTQTFTAIIKPNLYLNCLILYQPLFTVGIYGSSTFDVTKINLPTLVLSSSALIVTAKPIACVYSKINNDPYLDVGCYFYDVKPKWKGGDSTFTLTGQLIDKTPVQATGPICVIPKNMRMY